MKLLKSFLALAVFVPSVAWAQLVVQTAASAFCASDAGCSTRTITVNPSGNNRLIVVGVSIYQLGSQTVSSVVFKGSENFTQIGSCSATNSFMRTDMWRLIAPTTGSGDIVITLSASVDDTGWTTGAVLYNGADQTTPLGTCVTASGASTTPTVDVSSAATEIVQDAVITEASLTGVGSGQTERWRIDTGAGGGKGGGSTETGSATTTMSWTKGGSNNWAISAVAVKPAAAAVIKRRSQTIIVF